MKITLLILCWLLRLRSMDFSPVPTCTATLVGNDMHEHTSISSLCMHVVIGMSLIIIDYS